MQVFYRDSHGNRVQTAAAFTENTAFEAAMRELKNLWFFFKYRLISIDAPVSVKLNPGWAARLEAVLFARSLL